MLDALADLIGVPRDPVNASKSKHIPLWDRPPMTAEDHQKDANRILENMKPASKYGNMDEALAVLAKYSQAYKDDPKIGPIYRDAHEKLQQHFHDSLTQSLAPEITSEAKTIARSLKRI